MYFLSKSPARLNGNDIHHVVTAATLVALFLLMLSPLARHDIEPTPAAYLSTTNPRTHPMIPERKLPSNKPRRPHTRTVCLATKGAFAAQKDARINHETAGRREYVKRTRTSPVYIKHHQAKPKLQHALNTDTLRQMGWLT